jgi:hypothetical protein
MTTAALAPAQASTAPPAIKIPPFEEGARSDHLVSPRDTFVFGTTGVKVTVPGDVMFNVTPHLVDPDVHLVRCALAEAFQPFGKDIAFEGETYTLTPYGDGTACLTGLETKTGTHLYFPGAQYGDGGLFAVENAGFWLVERIPPGRKVAFIRRLGSGGVGVSQTLKAASVSDIQTAIGQDVGSALTVGPFTGVWPVVAATGRWLALRVSMPLPEMPEVFFSLFSFAQAHFGWFEVQTDQLAALRLNGGQSAAVLRPNQVGVESEMSRFEVRGFVTEVALENLSAQPMKLRAAYRLGK